MKVQQGDTVYMNKTADATAWTVTKIDGFTAWLVPASRPNDRPQSVDVSMIARKA